MAIYTKISDIIEELRDEGYRVTARKRSDGGVLITSINGEKFTGAKGNALARQLTGTALPEEFTRQLESIRPPLGVSPESRRVEPLPPDLQKAIRKAQRIYRKSSLKGKNIGRITTAQLRKVYKDVGYTEALRSLGEKVKYAKGIAYTKNVEIQANKLDALSELLAIDGENSASARISKISDYLASHRDEIKEADIEKMLKVQYSYNEGNLSAEEMTLEISDIFGVGYSDDYED